MITLNFKSYKLYINIYKIVNLIFYFTWFLLSLYFSDILATGKIPLSRSNTINESQGKEEEERCNEDGESPKEDQNKSGTPEPFEDPEDLEVKP